MWPAAAGSPGGDSALHCFAATEARRTRQASCRRGRIGVAHPLTSRVPPHRRREPCRGVAQSGSAPASGAGGRRFESCLPDHSVRDPGVPSRMPGSLAFWGSIAGGVVRTSTVRRLETNLLGGILRGRMHAVPGACSRLARSATGELQAQVQSWSNTRNSASHDASRHSVRRHPAASGQSRHVPGSTPLWRTFDVVGAAWSCAPALCSSGRMRSGDVAPWCGAPRQAGSSPGSGARRVDRRCALPPEPRHQGRRPEAQMRLL